MAQVRINTRVALATEKLDSWAKANGYARIGGLWRAQEHYLTVRRDSNDGPFVVEKRAYGSGARIADVAT